MQNFCKILLKHILQLGDKMEASIKDHITHATFIVDRDILSGANNNQSESFEKSKNLSEAELPLDMQFNEGHRLAIGMYLVVMFFSAIGNVYVFCSIMGLRKRGKLGRINLLLLNLATADLVVTFIMMPLEITWNATVSWLAGDVACRLLSFFRIFGLYLSSFVIICICLDRYFAFVKPLTIGDAQSRNKKLLCGAWSASVICSLPQSVIFHVERHPQFEWYEQCITFNSFPSPEYELAYNLFGFFLMYAVPMITILYCYSRILCKMYNISDRTKNDGDLRRSNVTVIKRAKTKTLKMTVITAIAFSVCWTPYNIISLWYWFDKSSAMSLDQRLQKILFVFACTNSCVNPLIYGWFHVGRNQRSNSEIIRINLRHRLAASAPDNINNMVSPNVRNHHRRCLSVMERDKRKIRIIENPRNLVKVERELRDHNSEMDLRESGRVKGKSGNDPSKRSSSEKARLKRNKKLNFLRRNTTDCEMCQSLNKDECQLTTVSF